jgi:hypothetical protein
MFDGTKAPIGKFQNSWRLWQKGNENTYAMALRGTIPTKESIEQDLLASSISATDGGISDGKGKMLTLSLAETEGAEVHLGFAYGMAVLMFHKEAGILNQVKKLVPPGSRIYITGHSQGAAMATLAHSFLAHAIKAPGDPYQLSDKHYALKSYVFAQPKPGNWEFAQDFGEIAGNRGMAYVVNNTRDFVPQVPLSIQLVDEPLSKIFPETYGGTEVKVEMPWYLPDVSLTVSRIIVLLQDIRKRLSAKVDEKVWKKMEDTIAELDPAYFAPGTVDTRKISGSSLNYTVVGSLISVKAERTPADRKADKLWQHHGITYKKLIDLYFKVP